MVKPSGHDATAGTELVDVSVQVSPLRVSPGLQVEAGATSWAVAVLEAMSSRHSNGMKKRMTLVWRFIAINRHRRVLPSFRPQVCR
ncbi:hypothetical protein [Candidatus Poriferisocius sp.]|uniref:hypothetical protein n=1 Tax=Candidatus Poriferisocius sp. TaxID=3101276 RepID=UPI003B5C7953